MNTPGSLDRRLRAFSLPPLLSTTASLIFLPVLARVVTTEEWVALAVGQSVGSAASIAITMGWTLNGPAAVAGGRSIERRDLYVGSLTSRALAFVVVAPMGALVAIVLTAPGQQDLAVTMTLAAALGGLSPTWFNIGVGAARDMLVFDLSPRVAATLAAAGALVLGLPTEVYPALLAVAAIGGVGAFSIRLIRREPRSAAARLPVRVLVRRQLSPAVTELAAGSYSAASLALVASQTDLQSMANYASGSRLYQFSLIAIIVLSQASQGWVAERAGHEHERLRLALRVHLLLGALGMVAITILGPPLTRVLFSDSLAVSTSVAAAFGTAFCAIAINTGLGRHVLVLGHRSGVILRSTIFGALVGVPLTLVMSARFGAMGGAAALAISEMAVCLYQVPASVKVLRAFRLQASNSPSFLPSQR